MTRILKLAILGSIVLAASLAFMNSAPSPWDLLILIVGATCVPLGIGLVTLTEGWQHRRGPSRVQAVFAGVLGLGQTLMSGRLLLGIFGWH
jgi:hypothetical protein